MDAFVDCVYSTVTKVRRKSFRARSASSQMEMSAGSEMPKVLGAIDLTFLGIGGIIGAGVFVLTGVAARQDAGPGVVVSYIIAAFAAVLSALCYTEFAVDVPVAGGAFVYVNLVFGEFWGWIAASNLILEYTLSSAAVARSFTSYASTLFGGDPNALRIDIGSELFVIDVPALAIVIVLCTVLAMGTQNGARFNTTVTIANLLVIAFVLGIGLPQLEPGNLTPFLPLGMHGVFSGASRVFFSFIGFDTVATAAEETKNPAVDLPMGIVTSLLICSVLYAAMCVTITGMVPWDSIDIHAPFATAFQDVDLGWASRVVSFGAVAGILTSLLVSLLGQARVWLVLGRENLIPSALATINSTTHAPVYATAVTAVTAGLFALFVDLEALADLVSIGTLSVFLLVALACIVRRYHVRGEPASRRLCAKLGCVVVSAAALSVSYAAYAPWWVMLVTGVGWAVATASLYTEGVVWTPAKFAIPLNPFLPCLAVLANVFLITSLGPAAWIRWVVWFCLSVVWYLAYGVHHSRDDSSYEMHLELGAVITRPPLSPVWEGSEAERSDVTEAYTSARGAASGAGRRSPSAALSPSRAKGSSGSLSRLAGASGGGNGADGGNGLLAGDEARSDAAGAADAGGALELPEA